MSERMADEVVWHDVENGAYSADLPTWRDLAAEAAGPVLEIGCGTGRVALALGREGFAVHGVDVSEPLVDALEDRARAEGLAVTAEVGDMTDRPARDDFALVVAPMQVFQLIDGVEERANALRSARAALAPGGRIAVALAEDVPPFQPGEGEVEHPLPDVREHEGRVYSSLPLSVEVDSAVIRVTRLRQRVEPGGDLVDEEAEERLLVLSAGTLESEARACGLAPIGRRDIPATEDHLGSTVVILEREES